MRELKFNSRELKLIFNEKMYMVRYPVVGDIRGYTEELNAEGAIELDVVSKMLSKLGLPMEVIEKMEMEFIEAIIEELTKRKKK